MKRKNEATKTESKIDWILRIKKQVEQDFTGEKLHRFGMCPKCFEAGEKFENTYLNINRNLFFYCDKHKVFWFVGSNLFSNWREETEEIWKRNFSQLKHYTKIDEWNPADMFGLFTIDSLKNEIHDLKANNEYLRHQLEEIGKLAKPECPELEPF